ncbi:Facilitated trehalose transporter Tret1-2 homolog-like Protein [Tribolium castaneum]|uniref:Facilitated trehalose transporter Tret1-2 homolog-like Protein n=2 Tax=Tribolium castaneum TaxID=7070 RepID=D6X028_TRICA|nr:Facilitated trehalose transporter Tret1-2 homolog-like Protein [Tribolium castaneum]
MTWTSPVLPKLYSNDSDTNPLGKPIDPDIESWIASLINIGAMVGPFPYGFIAERYGRKVSLLLIAIPHIISYVTFAMSKTAYLYYFGRLLGGIAVGGGYTVLPMYVAEVAEDSNRGTLSVTLNIFWTFGNLLPLILGPYLSIFWFNIILACVPTSFFVLFFLVAPESPYFLISKNKMNQAETSLLKLRSNNKKVVEDEIRGIKSELAKNESQETFLSLFKTRIYLKGLLISLVLIIAQQLSGVNALTFYTQEIFAAAGANGLKPEVSSIIIGLVIFGSSFATPFVVDRLGRRFLLLGSLLGITLAHLAFGAYFYLQTSTNLDISGISWLPLTSAVLFAVTFNTGLGPIPWTVSAELFPTSVKPYAASLVSFACWTTSFFVTKFFIDLKNGLGSGETYWLFGGFCSAAWFFTFFFVPETKGKSFQEIQEILER